jgi:hypothetical protein
MEYVMKKLISVLFLCSLYCSNSYADESRHSFLKQAEAKSDSKFTEYKAKLGDDTFLSFFVDSQEQKAVPVLFIGGQKYQPLSIKYCMKDSDECWRQIIYHNSLSHITYNFDKPENRKDLLKLKIEYIDNNQLAETDFFQAPLTGSLPDGDDDYDPYILWQSDLSSY